MIQTRTLRNATAAGILLLGAGAYRLMAYPECYEWQKTEMNTICGVDGHGWGGVQWCYYGEPPEHFVTAACQDGNIEYVFWC
jgi:hypothetical protein